MKEAPIFVCELCKKEHPSPGKDATTHAWLFPEETLTTSRREGGAISIHCIACDSQ